jgi:hypothetical protein
MATAAEAKATQDFVPVKEVRGGVIVLKEGGLRAIVLASSINFALKSSDEQIAILSQFQNFLNSLDFSVQIFIQSRKLDIRPYVALLEERETAQTNDLMKIQVREYIEFIKTFTADANIMSKSFFVVVPYTPAQLDVKSVSQGFFGKASNTSAEDAAQAFEEHRTQIEQRVSVVQQGLSACGVRSVMLGTEEVIELLYKLFNPGELDKPIPYETK